MNPLCTQTHGVFRDLNDTNRHADAVQAKTVRWKVIRNSLIIVFECLNVSQCLSSLAGQYVYIETSNPRRPGDKAYLVSPPVSGTQCLKFSYHMYGSRIGSLDVYQQNMGNRMVNLFKKSGGQGNQWNKAEVQINSGNRYSVSIIQF